MHDLIINVVEYLIVSKLCMCDLQAVVLAGCLAYQGRRHQSGWSGFNLTTFQVKVCIEERGTIIAQAQKIIRLSPPHRQENSSSLASSSRVCVKG